jgi:hypothetical protein
VIPIVRSLYEALGVLPRRGYKFKPRDRDSFLYIEGDHKLVIRGEMLLGDLDFVVYRGVTENHWMPPHEGEAISPEKMEEIFQRVDEYMKEEGIRYEIQD